jgi:hypothetical protein
MKANRWLFVVLGWSWVCGAHAQAIDLQALVRDTQVMRQTGTTMDMVWWMPTEFWRASFSSNAAMSSKQVDELVGMVDDYIVLSIIESNIGTLGVLSSTPREDLEKKVVLVVGDKELRAVPESKLSSGANKLLTMMKPVTANMMGQVGQGMHFIAFEGLDADGKALVEAKKPGRMTVKVGAKEFAFRLPLGSVLPAKLDKESGERFPGNYEFNPFTGKKLTAEP